jgi:hypothetical protein
MREGETDGTGGTAPIEAAWDEAFMRVESYLRAHQVESRILLNRLTVEIIAAARVRAAAEPGSPPLKAAMDEANERLGAWFSRLLGDERQRRVRLGPQGRLALMLTGVAQRWPQCFLAADEPPPELVAAMRASYVEVGPEMQFSNMAPRPIDLGPLANAAGDTWEMFRRRPWLRMVLALVVVAGLLALVWEATR